MSIVRWEPFHDFMTLREAMDHLFEDSFVSPRRRDWQAPVDGALALDMYETESAVVVKSSIPGVKPDDVEISVSGNTLSISGKTKVEDEVKEEDYIRRERRYGAFSRSVRLPEGVDANKAEASFEDGVLTVTLPKVPEAKPKAIKVQSKEKPKDSK
jgi:HSP20 family protein